MEKYKVEFVQTTNVTIEADSLADALDSALNMDGEDIAEHDPHEYSIRKISMEVLINGGEDDD